MLISPYCVTSNKASAAQGDFTANYTVEMPLNVVYCFQATEMFLTGFLITGGLVSFKLRMLSICNKGNKTKCSRQFTVVIEDYRQIGCCGLQGIVHDDYKLAY